MESSLSLKVADIASEIGVFAGFGAGADNDDTVWSTEQSRDIYRAIKSGLRQFYFPAPLMPGESSYDWSFLKPIASLAFAEGETTVDLPDDFGGLEGKITVSTATSTVCESLRIVNPGILSQLFAQQADATGIPQAAALIPIKGTSQTEGQRSQLYLYPTADAAYTLTLQYYVLPNYLDTYHPYAYGGASHSETIMAACKMAYEESRNNMFGVWAVKFKERLAASISLDRRQKPQDFGYNGDSSDGMDRRYMRQPATVTYNGVAF